jgi:transposase
MAKQAKQKNAARRKYTPEERSEALALADKVGVPAAAAKLDLSKSQLYGWRSRARAKQAPSDTGQLQAAEITRLEGKLARQAEELAILKKAAAYFSNSPG